MMLRCRDEHGDYFVPERAMAMAMVTTVGQDEDGNPLEMPLEQLQPTGVINFTVAAPDQGSFGGHLPIDEPGSYPPQPQPER
eukprot:COSAG06_NODE_28397_length_575_cov_0.779412_2_plen_82_part_00